MSLQSRIFLVAAGLLTVAVAVGVWAAVRMQDLRIGVVVAVVLGLAAAAILTLFVRGQVTEPVQRIAETTGEMARSGRLSNDLGSLDLGTARIPAEVRELSTSLSQLIESVARSQSDRERSYVEAIGAVVAAVDARDQETSGHSFRVSRYAVALAKAMGVSELERLRAIEWGSLLHDVGKIAVPDAILRKVGPLTEEEWHIMRQHASWGYEILADVQFLRPSLEIVHGHHERWDGAGYPRGLSGERIPLAARIFAVVDTYDAITSERPYRRAHSHRAAVAELDRVAGSQLDPSVVEAFLTIPEVELRRLRAQHSRPHLGSLIDNRAELEGLSATSVR